MSSPSSSSKSAKADEILVIASSEALRAAGLDMGLIDAVPLLLTSADAIPSAGTVLPRIMIGRVKAAGESTDDIRAQLLYLSQSLKTIGQMSNEEVANIIAQVQPALVDPDRNRFKKEYGVLTIEEMADRMSCTIKRVRELELEGDLFAARAPGRDGGPLYPKFQLDERVIKSLLKQVIHQYREAEVSTTMLWSFLRAPQKIFHGWTPMEMMLGASSPAFDALTPEEWKEAFLDVVAEEISRVRW
ncbi:MAG: hypothetical protein V4542_13905 [Pseudomonadota bacterium]